MSSADPRREVRPNSVPWLVLLSLLMASALAAAVADGALEANRALWALRAVVVAGPVLATIGLVDARRGPGWLGWGTGLAWTIAVLTVPLFGAGLLLMPSAAALTAAVVIWSRRRSPPSQTP